MAQPTTTTDPSTTENTPGTADPTSAQNNLDTTPPESSAGDTPESGADGSADEGDAAGSEPESIDGSGVKKSRAQERIRELIEREKATREWGEYWYRKAREAAGKAAGEPAEGSGAPAGDDPAPTLADYNFDAAKWSAAMTEWTAREVQRQTQRAAAQHSAMAETAAKVAEFNARAAKFAETVPDYRDVVSNPALPISEAMRDVIVASENGPALAYHLGKNPGEAARIYRMTPVQQAAALGRLEAKLAAPPKAPAKKTTNAPRPPSTIDGGAASTVNLETCSLDDFLAARARQRAARHR